MLRRSSLYLACILLALSFVLSAHAQPQDKLSLLSRADSLQTTGVQLTGSGDYEDALASITESLEIRRTLLGERHPDYARSLHALGTCYMFMSDFENAIQNLTEASEILGEVLGEKDPEYAKSLINLGTCYRAIGEVEEAMTYLTEAQDLLRATVGERHTDYASCLSAMAACQLYLGEFEEALSLYTEATDIWREAVGESHPSYAACLNDIGACLMYLGDYEQAITYHDKVKDIRREVRGERHPDYAMTLNNLGACYMFLGDYDKAIAYYMDALSIYREVFGDEHPSCAQTLLNLGNCYQDLDDFEKAISCTARSVEIYQKVFGEEHPYYITALNNLGSCYTELGDYEKGIRYYSRASDLMQELYGEDQPEYATSLNNLAICYEHLSDSEKAASYYEKALEIRREVLGEDHPECAVTLHNLASLYYTQGDYEKSIEYNLAAMDIVREVLGEDHPYYATSLLNLGLCYDGLGDYGKAIEMLEESLRISREAFGERHSDCASVLGALGDIYRENGNYAESSRCFHEYVGIARDLVLAAFTYLPGSLRASYWAPYSNFFQTGLPFYCQVLSEDPSFLQLSYDGALLSKGLLLNAETEIRKLILESGDASLVSLYEQYVQERLQLERLYELPASERTMDVDSLVQVCENLEQSLQKGSRSFGDYTRNLSVSWTDVRDALGEGEIAIEFMEIVGENDSISYGALTLKRGYDNPHYVDLFKADELAALKDKYASAGNPDGLIYGDAALYDLVWKPLSRELEGVETIYFGPSGELYQTAIEYAFTGSGPFSDEKNIYRLSSTRQLALPQERGQLLKSAVYGGFRYGMPESALISDSRKYALREERGDLFFNVDSLGIRGAGGAGFGVSDLPGTEKEVSLVSEMLRRRGIEVREVTGEDGTEASFKDLDGRGENVIHIATHGFYWEGDARLAERTNEDASMTRSGLLFSGANNALRKGYVRREGLEDGILTAQEIAQLDFRGADLVVLSACQTGLGEVSGEGVFGLQRGFKKAGARTILMSLWEVDDEATQLLMTEFYKGLTAGKTKTEALKSAQAAVRGNKGRDFTSPYYWASFILLDGME